LALLKTGNNIAAKIAIMAMTTNNSINVKPGAHLEAENASFRLREAGLFIAFCLALYTGRSVNANQYENLNRS
jgi:hypothetical protein